MSRGIAADHQKSQSKNPLQRLLQGVFWGNSLTMSYFHTGNPHYHRR